MAFKNTLGKLIFKLMKVGFLLLFFGAGVAGIAWLYIKTVVQGEVVDVPNLVGMSQEEARATVESQNLVFRVDQGVRVFSSVIPKDRVYLQVPRPGRKIKTGREVEITISAGPEQRRIPELTGETLPFAQTLLRDVGEKVDLVSRVPSSLYPRGRVLNQSIEAGALLDSQHERDKELGLVRSMAVVVSDGPQEPLFVTPRLIGRDYALVKEFLDRHEIRMITRYRSDDPELGPVILKQIPEPGYPFHKGQTINLTVNKDF